MEISPDTKLSLEWVKEPEGISLFFDKATWEAFKLVAETHQQSPEHMILRAVVGCLGSILEDNMVLNRILRRPDEHG
jgi:hypothetical protein